MSIPRLQAHSVRPIAARGPRRMAKLPEVGTFQEQGITDRFFGVTAWHAIRAPAGIPNDIRGRLSRVMVEAGGTDTVKRTTDSAGIDEPASDWREGDRPMKEEAPIIISVRLPSGGAAGGRATPVAQRLGGVHPHRAMAN